MAAAGSEMTCSEEPQVQHWALQNAPGIVTKRTGPQEEAFLGEQGLESLASNWFIKCFILDRVFRVILQLLQAGEAEGRKMKQVLAESHVMVP